MWESLVFGPTVGANVLGQLSEKSSSSYTSTRLDFKDGGLRRSKLGTAGGGPARPLRCSSWWNIQERIF
ncbi:hypothetical protein PIB30_049154, partial [Stylosanthes scabra]|nr:hypothetical protein [Stylosanthes scabra]